MIAIGKSKAVGSMYSVVGEVSADDMRFITAWLEDNVPVYLCWAKNFIVNIMFYVDFK